MFNSYRNLPELAGFLCENHTKLPDLWGYHFWNDLQMIILGKIIGKSIQMLHLHLKLMINREKCLQKCLFLLCNALVDFSKDKREFLCIVGFKFKEPCWIQLTSCEDEEVPLRVLKGFYAMPEAFTILDFILKRLLQIALLRPLLVLMIYVLVSCWLIFH